MSNPSKLSYQLVAAVANGVSLAQQPLAAGLMTLNGSLVNAAGVATFDAARRVSIASTGADGAVVFTVVGTDRNGNVQSTTVTGVTSAAAQYTVLDFLTVTAVLVSAGTAGNITVGTNSIGSSTWVLDNWLAPTWMLAIACSGPAGTTYTVEHTYDDFMQVSPLNQNNWSLEPGSTVPATAWPNPTIQSVIGQSEMRYTEWPVFGHRLTIMAGTGLVTMWSIQSGIGSP